MSKNNKRVFKKGHILLQEGEKKIYCYLVPRRYPLVLPVKVGSRQGRECLEVSKAGVLGRRMLKNATDVRS
jgi:hypothetical protein